ncbi:MAG: SMC family ATPase [Syntrophothermus sp.]|uniref:AAA family ATPase n=1 Tax=Syntrophothermus sp. TaxID=2736299 RepID=UPI00257BEACA|nr:SMC family ATPase [Syntrophothermus sp.]NSW82306.1 SMC family ATPase [Syntrophothermus sp.]
MKPIKIIVTAFGPYAGTQVVDFNELGGHSLFLVHGPTGAGKTTVLDAICFALYGETTSTGRDGKNMRSHHCSLGEETKVVFEFALGDGVYKVERWPEQERPRQRGQGTRVQPAAAALYQKGVSCQDEEWAVLASGVNAVNEKVESLLGFTAAEFRQVVVLPQGEFRKLLTASSRERQDILETLFHIDEYSRIEEALRESAAEAKKQVEKLSQQRGLILQAAEAQDAQELEARRHRHEMELKEVAEALGKAAEEVKRRQLVLNEAQKVEEKIKEKEEAETAWIQLESQRPQMEAAKRELEQARRAAALVDLEEAVLSRRKEAARLKQAVENSDRELKTAREKKQSADQALKSRLEQEPEREELRQKLGWLRDLLEKIELLQNARQAENQAFAVLKKAEVRLDKIQKKVADIETRREEVMKARLAALEVAAEAGTREKQYRDWEENLQRRQRLEELRQELSSVQESYQTAELALSQAQEGLNRARGRYKEVQDSWVRAQAVVLANQLVPGRPCPVCGSVEHPAPAQAAGEFQGEDALRAAEREWQRAETGFQRALKEFNSSSAQKNTAENRVRDLEAELGNVAKTDIQRLQARVVEARRLWQEALKASRDAGSLASELRELERQAGQAKEEASRIEKAVKDAQAKWETARAVREEREAGVPPELREKPVIEAEIRSVQTRLKSLNDALENARKDAEEAGRDAARAEAMLQGLTNELERTDTRLREEETRFYSRLQENGFPDLHSYHHARKALEEIAEMEQAVSQFERALHTAKERYERARRAAEGLPPPDLPALAAELEIARNRWEQLETKKIELENGIRADQKWLKALLKVDEKLEKAEAEYGVLGRLADVASGKNSLGLSFRRFVLGALLDDVALAASERLKVMSRGRYQLRRTVERTRARGAAGLDLVIFDAYTGLERSAATLSGGESFLAALSLALGLADVVESYAGGIRLDTIFVDEGFGSLDPETLDLAMDALIDLQLSGRLVGIISHVPELKERIPARLEIRPTEKGSTARFVVG